MRIATTIASGIVALCYCTSSWTKEKDASAPVPSEERTQFKLTPSFYQSSDGNNASDINLRVNRGAQDGWIGFYKDHAGYQQTRAGYEYTTEYELARIIWSSQVASGGFLGGSINAQVGGTVYGLIGFGRTNLKNFYNLNFDPNDMITLGFGFKASPQTEMSLYHIWDDRLGTRQRATHFYVHHAVSDAERFSVDLSYKRGINSDDIFIKGYAASVTYSYLHYFVRLAHDQYVNFSTTNQTRLSLGMTF